MFLNRGFSRHSILCVRAVMPFGNVQLSAVSVPKVLTMTVAFKLF